MDLSKTKYNCIHCGKCYLRLSSLDKHRVLCDLQHSSSLQHKIASQEADDVPSYQQLVNIVQQLHIQTKNLEIKLENKAKTFNKKAIIDFINDKFNNQINFVDWLARIDLKIQIEKLWSKKINEIVVLLLNTIFNENNSSEVPFIFHKNKCFVYTSEKWKELNIDNLKLLSNKLHEIYFNQLTSWNNLNQTLLIKNDQLAINYNQLLLGCLNIPKKTTLIKQYILENLKNNLQT
mgnify:CR=1 FL=1